MTNAKDLKAGQRIRITLEATLRDDATVRTPEETAGIDLLQLEVDWDGIKPGRVYDYTDITDIPITAIEVIKPPLKPGLYYLPDRFGEDEVDQISRVLKYDGGGHWSNNMLESETPTDEEIARMQPLIRGER
jgi:hypothetical protein